ncbi:MAG TPA: hypothetical protein DGG94_04115 [Micromonosporaceae bacterium]|nr:hypothetical protein [Micromonosporaceae bacterium]HCU48984.1 hypothetical protein [Micromonosporaceae bacterium]
MAAAFPQPLAANTAAAARLLLEPAHHQAQTFKVTVDGENVVIPYRICSSEPAQAAAETLTSIQQTILSCWLTRHNDGFIRQRHLERIIRQQYPWVVPFVVQLAGEYVWQIVEAINRELSDVSQPGTTMSELYGDFAFRNPEFVDLTEQRAISYWNCYMRSRYLDLRDHPTRIFAKAVRQAGRDPRRNQ